MTPAEVADILPILDAELRNIAASRSIEIADRRRRLARLVLICDPAMVTALEGVMGLRGGT